MSVSKSIAGDVAERLYQAAEANRTTTGRNGSLVQLPSEDGGELMVSADLHGNRLNFQRLCEVADLENHPQRHLVMQEVCHGGPEYPADAGCMSHLLLEDVAKLKLQFPDRFHFILSNHELAELTDYPISKNRRLLNLSFRQGIASMYGDAADDVRRGYSAFLQSCPLAVRLAWGAFVCHSVPEHADLVGFDAGVFDRQLVPSDLLPHGPAFRLVWGRDYRQENAAAFAKMVEAHLLVHGHEPCPNGYSIPNSLQIILDCCGPSACFLMLPGDRPLTHAEAIEQIRFLEPTSP